MISYSQSTGRLIEDGHIAGLGYSGNREGLNNPDKEDAPCVGPIPRGVYKIGPWHDDPHHGPCVTHLFPVGHNAKGRSGFMIHGDNQCCNHSASKGCIILPRAIRTQLRANAQTRILVVR
jgi:hypothetical protein